MHAFAKLVFSTIATLSPGTDLPWPAMSWIRSEGIYEQVAIEDVWVPPTICQVGDPNCVPRPGGFVGGQTHRYLCVAQPGDYSITFRIGMRPLPKGAALVTGQVWLMGASALLITRFTAEAERWTAGGATHVVTATAAHTCWQLRYDANGTAELNHDFRVTYLTAHRVN